MFSRLCARLIEYIIKARSWKKKAIESIFYLLSKMIFSTTVIPLDFVVLLISPVLIPSP